MYCNVCNKDRKSKKNPKYFIYFLKKTLILSIVYSKCGHGYEKILKEEESVEILKILGVIINIVDETRNYLTEEINK